MILIKAKFEILYQHPGIQGVYEQSELPGRICYGSQDKIAPGTAQKFCEGLMKSNHGAPLEHNGVYLSTTNDSIASKYKTNKYSKVNCEYSEDPNIPNIWNSPTYHITTNLRVLFENGWLDDLQYFSEPTKYHEKRITVSFTVDRFTGEEFLRHRVASFNRESTRYINFTKDKFGGGDIKFILPPWVDENTKPIDDAEYRAMCRSIYLGEDQNDFADITYWLFALKTAEYSYNNLIRLGWKPQQARTVLPCAINSPLIKTAFVSDWVHFFNLRALGTTGAPHPQAKELAWPLMMDFVDRGLITLELNEENISKSKIELV